MIKLFIDTRDNKKVIAKLEVNGSLFESISTNKNSRPESIITLIDLVCKKAEVAVTQVDEINIEEGPGSYTGLKVGSSVANALSFALNRKVNGKDIGTLIEPTYE